MYYLKKAVQLAVLKEAVVIMEHRMKTNENYKCAFGLCAIMEEAYISIYKKRCFAPVLPMIPTLYQFKPKYLLRNSLWFSAIAEFVPLRFALLKTTIEIMELPLKKRVEFNKKFSKDFIKQYLLNAFDEPITDEYQKAVYTMELLIFIKANL